MSAADPAEFEDLEAEAAALGLAAAPLPVERRTVPTSGGEVGAILWGEHPRLTLLHGAGLNAHTWDDTLLALGEPAIALDLPGHGDSEWREDFDYSPGTNAAAVAEVLDALGAGPQLVVGQSLGGLTAIELAARRPELVRGLVIVDATPGIRRGDAEQVRGFLAGPNVFPSRDAIVEAAIAAGIGSDRERLARGVRLNTRVREDGTVVWKHHLGYPPEGAELLGIVRASWEGLTGTEVPVVLVRATHGYLSPEVLEEFREAVPRAEIVEIASGHNVQEQAPLELAEVVREALG